jgi:hypothetical protein
VIVAGGLSAIAGRSVVPQAEFKDNWHLKVIAEKLMSQKPQGTLRSLYGVDLKIGGEGMQGYYDKIVPQTVEEYLRNAGVPGKVQPLMIKTREPYMGGRLEVSSDGTNFWLSDVKTKEKVSGNFDSYLSADDAREAHYLAEEKGMTRQPGVRLSPEQIEYIKKNGLPFYSVPAGVGLNELQEVE